MKKIFTAFLLFVICSVNFCIATDTNNLESMQQTTKNIKPFEIPTDINSRDLEYRTSAARKKTNAAFIDWAKENLGYSQEEAEKLEKWVGINKLKPLPETFYEIVTDENCKIFVENSENRVYGYNIDEYVNMVKFYDIYKKIRPNDNKYALGIIAKGNYIYYANKVMTNEKLTDKQKVRKFERSVAFADIMNKSHPPLGILFADSGEYGRYIKSYKYHSLPYKTLSPIALIPSTTAHIVFPIVCIPGSIVAFPFILWIVISTAERQPRRR